RRDEQPVDVAAEPVSLLRVGDGRSQHFGHIAGHAFARELQRRERAVHVLAANEIEHEAGLLCRRPHVAGGGLRFDHDSFPAGFAAPAAGAAAPAPAGAAAPAAPGPPGAPAAAAAAAAAARSATRVVWPLKMRVGANSPSLW